MLGNSSTRNFVLPGSNPPPKRIWWKSCKLHRINANGSVFDGFDMSNLGIFKKYIYFLCLIPGMPYGDWNDNKPKLKNFFFVQNGQSCEKLAKTYFCQWLSRALYVSGFSCLGSSKWTPFSKRRKPTRILFFQIKTTWPWLYNLSKNN